MDWEAFLEEKRRRHDALLTEPPREGERADLRAAAVGSASWAAGLALLMLGRPEEARQLLRRAADEYVASWDVAPAGSWGRPIAVLKCRLLAADLAGARRDAARTLAEGPLPAATAVARYAATLAALVLGDDATAAAEADELGREELGREVAPTLAALARRDAAGYDAAVRTVLRSFEERDAFLEDARVADTVLALQALAEGRGLAIGLESPLLPTRARAG